MRSRPRPLLQTLPLTPPYTLYLCPVPKTNLTLCLCPVPKTLPCAPPYTLPCAPAYA